MAVGGDCRLGRGGGGGAGLCCWGESFVGGEASLSGSPSSIVSIARFLGFVGERERSVGERGDVSCGVIEIGDFGDVDALRAALLGGGSEGWGTNGEGRPSVCDSVSEPSSCAISRSDCESDEDGDGERALTDGCLFLCAVPIPGASPPTGREGGCCVCNGVSCTGVSVCSVVCSLPLLLLPCLAAC
jgi:hypothetical protein